MEAYPPNIIKPSQSGFNRTESPRVRQSDSSLGLPVGSRYSSDIERVYNLTWQNMPRGMARLFRQWLRDTLDDGNKPFTIDLNGTTELVRFIQKPSMDSSNANTFSYSATVEARRFIDG